MRVLLLATHSKTESTSPENIKVKTSSRVKFASRNVSKKNRSDPRNASTQTQLCLKNPYQNFPPPPPHFQKKYCLPPPLVENTKKTLIVRARSRYAHACTRN